MQAHCAVFHGGKKKALDSELKVFFSIGLSIITLEKVTLKHKASLSKSSENIPVFAQELRWSVRSKGPLHSVFTCFLASYLLSWQTEGAPVAFIQQFAIALFLFYDNQLLPKWHKIMFPNYSGSLLGIEGLVAVWNIECSAQF